MFSQSLKDLLFILDQEKIPESDAELIKSAIIQKVDNCAIVEREMEDEVKRLRSIAREFGEAAKAAENRLARFMEYVRWAMEQNGFEKLPGEKFLCEIRENPARVMIEHEPTSFDAEAYPDLVRLKYEWDKNAIKASIHERDIPFARLVREKRAVFGINRGKK